MARLCLTATDGTWFHGMVRGLRITCAGTGLRVRARCCTVDDLVEGCVPMPAILSLYLSPATARRDPRYHERWGWVIGQRHVVVLLGFDGDRPFVADPGTGFEHWSRQALDDLFAGRVIWLAGG